MDVWRNDGSLEGKKTISSKNVGQSITHHREARNEKGAASRLHLARAKIKIVSTAQMGSLDGYLNLCEVVCCVLLVPRAIEVAEAGVAAELHSLLFDIGQGFGHRL